MLASEQIEELICLLSSWDRPTIESQFQNFQSSFPVDFTTDFFEQVPLEKLRHVFLALCLQNQRMPAAESCELSVASCGMGIGEHLISA